MNSLRQHEKSQAFTLVEMLVVIAIIAVLAALLLPALTRGKQRAQRVECIGNLKEMGTAFQMFAHDHQGKFPMQTPQAEGGSQEFVTAGSFIPGPFYFSYRHLQALANELVVPRILVCPADREREPALSFGVLQNSNVSYFVGVGADYNTPSSVLAGDRNIESDVDTSASLLYGGRGLRWTRELHSFKGNILFADTHVEQMNTPHIEFAAGTGPGTVIALPTTPPNSSSPGSSPGSGSDPSPSPSPSPNPSPSPATAGTPGSGGSPSSNPSPPQRMAAPQNASSQPPSRPSPMPAGNSMAGSQMANHSTFSTTTFTDTHAKETNGDAAVRAAAPIAVPASDNDDIAPSIQMLGAARAYVATSPWWLWLLLLLLIAGAAYLFFSKKKRPVRRR